MIWGIVVLALLGAPLFAVFGALAMLAYQSGGMDFAIVIGELTRLTNMPMLQALPMFALAGYVLAGSRASERLLRLTRAAFGWMPGGLAMVCIVTCTFMTAFTGASGVTIVALGGLLLPALLQDGYREKAALGLVTTGGNMGVLFVPSLPLILYAIIAQPISPSVTVQAVFRAGVLPGLLALAVLSLYGIRAGIHARIPRHPFRGRELAAALWEAKWEIPLPFVVLGGIYSGWLVASEAAVLTAAYVLVIEVLVYREIPVHRLTLIVRDTVVLVGGVLLILGMGMAITNFLIFEQVPQLILEWVGARITHPLVFLMALNLFLLAVGCIMDIYTATIVIVPLLAPLAVRYGIDPVHLAIIFLANLAIGYSTPPVGMNLFIAAMRLNRPLMKLAAASLALMGLMLGVLALITYWPALSLALVN
ncbi:MAG: TRAP transporter large permease [Kiritimatiellae bacterium]|nr:TRAP transporter large permease [Kiritimatiellia bacterium]MDD3440737.1 TRAP transporter large permease [Kiritimatiellia bacterium]NCC93437.1 TRAP transporter large permease [Opitutae bacterium]